MKLRLILSVIMVGVVSFASVQPAFAAKLLTGNSYKKVCDQQKVAVADCGAHVVLNNNGTAAFESNTYVDGYAPGDIVSAYKLPAPSKGPFAWNGQTVAIVDAYDNPYAASDLLAYRQQFNLPLCASSSATPSVSDLTSCFFTKLNQSGAAAPLPKGDITWGQEIDLDIEMVSAACPGCKIVLLEANSNNLGDLGTAVNTAAAMHVNAISNSYGAAEFSSETTSPYSAYYNHPGIAITVSSGDLGYGAQFPASSPYVTAVGGTSLSKDSSPRGWSETVWRGAGSGCSAYAGKLSWQAQIPTCGRRMVADVAAVADPNTGVAVYNSYGSYGGNWYVFGGTSVAAPIIAGIYALAGHAGGSAPAIQYSEYLYAHAAGNLNDVISGSNGNCSPLLYKPVLALCNGTPGYDGPTGLGTPNGIGAF
jgi:subtilase family serine protease